MASRRSGRGTARGTGGAGVVTSRGSAARAPSYVCEHRMQSLPDRPQPTGNSEVVFHGHVRKPDEGTRLCPSCPPSIAIHDATSAGEPRSGARVGPTTDPRPAVPAESHAQTARPLSPSMKHFHHG